MFHFFITLQLEFSDQGCHCLVEQNEPMFWETKGKEHPLFKECCSSKKEAQSSAFPSYFLSELPSGRLPAFLPRCVSQTSMDLAELPWLLGAVSLPRLDAELRGSQSSGRATATERGDFQVCQALEKP